MLEQLPASAFDSPSERARVGELLERYNHPASPEHGRVWLSPQLDASFAGLAEERVARQPLRQYLGLPARRVINLWFDTHSDFYPFGGALYASAVVPANARLLRVLFMALTWSYTLCAALGAWSLARRADGRGFLLCWIACVLPRLGFLSMLENPEPRYVIEWFPSLASLAGVAFAMLHSLRHRAPRVFPASHAFVTRAPPVRPETSR